MSAVLCVKSIEPTVQRLLKSTLKLYAAAVTLAAYNFEFTVRVNATTPVSAPVT